MWCKTPTLPETKSESLHLQSIDGRVRQNLHRVPLQQACFVVENGQNFWIHLRFWVRFWVVSWICDWPRFLEKAPKTSSKMVLFQMIMNPMVKIRQKSPKKRTTPSQCSCDCGTDLGSFWEFANFCMVLWGVFSLRVEGKIGPTDPFLRYVYKNLAQSVSPTTKATRFCLFPCFRGPTTVSVMGIIANMLKFSEKNHPKNSHVP